ncbi:hypothetical protein NDU88_002796 [Pleurodeles waltl]|uniref:Reverse transcriptase domain-containing protein n=1 Tax=Pleurodeles waltl TaxID=8319 RepID=A0AAV7W529_PLEWA|nr:hypothetical protein NDU88_002796 [Pleurodeles waltl]
MSWDYTGTQQLLHSMDDLSVAPARLEVNALNAETVSPSPYLHLIYQTITAQHKQTQRDSKKARVATKQLQVAVSKVAKTCSEIGERIAAIECRADVLESDLGAVTKQAAMHETQLSDIQWKVEDFENRQRRNNLRLIGIQEGENLFSDDREERITQYLSDIPCPELTQDEDCQLTAPIELDEIISALTALSNGKATGPDMIPIEFLKTFFEELKDDIMALFTSVQAGERVPGSWLEANIVIFLKKEKNPLLPGSYRPISLINADAKWYAKILAEVIAKYFDLAHGNGRFKILTYADDIDVTTPEPGRAIEEIEKLAVEFGEISGYALNTGQ